MTCRAARTVQPDAADAERWERVAAGFELSAGEWRDRALRAEEQLAAARRQIPGGGPGRAGRRRLPARCVAASSRRHRR